MYPCVSGAELKDQHPTYHQVRRAAQIPALHSPGGAEGEGSTPSAGGHSLYVVQTSALQPGEREREE